MISTEVFVAVLVLHQRGYSMRWIAGKLGIHLGGLCGDLPKEWLI